MLRHAPSAAYRLLPSCFIAPCLPTLARAVPDGPQWVREIKHDGYRFIYGRDGDRLRVFSRWGEDCSRSVHRRGAAIAPARSATIDGEAVVCDARGVTDFDALRAAVSRRQGSRGVFLYAFDLIELEPAATCEGTHGRAAARRWHAFCAKPTAAFD
jgi:bifunctional non-homologous end joining protein LigD